MGVDQYLPGLSENLIGLEKGAEREIVLNLPDDFKRRELAGQEVRLRVTIKGLKRKVLPELDDAFARDLGDYQGLDDFKQKLRRAWRGRSGSALMPR